ncbi:MAG: hypothetical protein QXJ06_03355 [Candidatus Aenigmatarchaeota archaeon]
MAIFNVELKQHTPIIHFQHYQRGATLRASELKPKLDKFLIKYFTEKDIDYKKWLIGNGEHNALNYRVKIIQGKDSNIRDGKVITVTNRYPLFFGNMGKNYKNYETIKKFVFYEGSINVIFSSFDDKLLSYIKENISNFLALENFGSRQDKGFGSFYISNLEIDKELFNHNFTLNVEGSSCEDKFRNLFKQLDLFYKAIRSGINLKDRKGNTTIYFKSLLFLYFKQRGIQWEKKTIKQKFFLNDYNSYLGLCSQIKKYPKSDVLSYNSENKKLVKDLLGLSTKEAWTYYKNRIKKTEAKNVDGKWVKKDKNVDKDIIERFKSPIFFKIIENKTEQKTISYTIYIKLNDDIPIRGKWFIIEEKNGNNFPLQIPSDFKLTEFFNFIINKDNFNINKHVDTQFYNCGEYKILENIFNQLQNNNGTK